jgi:hypothetical protein
VARITWWVSRIDGHPRGYPMEGERVPIGGGRVPNGGCMGARWRAGLGGWPNSGSRGWPDGGVYKSGRPTFLDTLLQHVVSPARNAGA